ncbi:oligogalacturonide lyase [Hydrogenispora ethanolica]|uniref:Oligogalacturonide lyase n=1 Tax=Hydrogenispora ethanolica TaxID=1082276 RepID=A0A4R1QZB2_HYDET|nr:oligogalacturonate lyase family protein [Hydrogenispora ethanolica]TCL58319.1 oligogalacturonide lyase [Hydrogenispora ethanolica]
MIGKEFPAEKRFYRDEKTGLEVAQLTGGGSNNYHFYFTDNSFTVGDREIYFLSDRSSQTPRMYDLFKLDLESGIITQVTAEARGVHGHTKTPDSEILVYVTGNQLKKLDPKSGRSEVIYETGPETVMAAPFISPDKKYVGIPRNEKVRINRGANYSGFQETMFATKKGWITLVYLDGSGAEDIYEDTHWLGHFQFAPDDSAIATYCHEGPWNLVQQRIWLLDLVKRSVKPCFRQGADDCVGHEFWTRDGLIFFDNRRKGHDGTITSDRTQATTADPEDGQTPYIGLADKNGEVIRTIDMPFYCNHYHANNDNTLLVGDEVEDLVLIEIGGQEASLRTLCTHKTSWYTQRVHCHPTFSWDSQKILFTSDRDGKANLYLADLEQLAK